MGSKEPQLPPDRNFSKPSTPPPRLNMGAPIPPLEDPDDLEGNLRRLSQRVQGQEQLIWTMIFFVVLLMSCFLCSGLAGFMVWPI